MDDSGGLYHIFSDMLLASLDVDNIGPQHQHVNASVGFDVAPQHIVNQGVWQASVIDPRSQADPQRSEIKVKECVTWVGVCRVW